MKIAPFAALLLVICVASACGRAPSPPAPAPAANNPAASAPTAKNQATNAYLDGLDALAAGKYAAADQDFTTALGLDDENPAYYQARGIARTFNENFDDALKDFQKAARLASQPDWETTAWSATASKMNNHPEVTFAPATAGQQNRDYAVALTQLAQNYWQSKNNGSYYDPTLKKTVTTKESYKGDFPQVAKFYVDRHLALAGGRPSNAGAANAPPVDKALLARIQSQIAAGQNLEALQFLATLLAGNPADVDLLAARAQVLTNLNDFEDARTTYTDLLTRQLSAVAYLGRARAAAREGDSARAKSDLAQATPLDAPAAGVLQRELLPLLSTTPADPRALWTTLETQARAGAPLDDTALAVVRSMAARRIRYDERYQDRLSPLEAALKAKPNDGTAMVAVARFIHDESKVLDERVGPRAEPTPYRIQSAADLQHDLDRAAQLVDAAYKSSPNNLAVLIVKAHFLIDAADYDTAQDVVNHALTLKKDDPDLLEVLASLVQIQAARHISAAGNLRLPKTFFETNYLESPPVTYKWTIWPSRQELAMAAAHEQQANALSQLAQAQLEKAATAGGATAQGYYYRATLLRVRGQSADAKDYLTKAVALQGDFQQAWYLLAAVCTDLLDADGAVAARAKAYSLANTTASAQLNTLWFRIAHAQLKAARDTVAGGVQIDPADPRLPAYLAVIDEAADKPADALAHWRMAQALNNAILTLHGTQFAPTGRLPLTPERSGLPTTVRLRMAALLLDQKQPAPAAALFNDIVQTLTALPDSSAKIIPADALLPNPDIAPGMIPPDESIGTLGIRAATGLAYATWAAAAKDPADVALAAKTYRRLFIQYTRTTDNLESLQAIGDLGLTELYLHSQQYPQAAAALKSTPAVPQEFWQEMRQTESDVRATCAPDRGTALPPLPRGAPMPHDPAALAALFHEARQVHAAGNRAQAEQKYLAILTLDDTHVGANMMLASLLTQRREFAPAIERLQRTASAHPDDPGPLNVLALTLAADNRLAEAQAACQKSLALRPQPEMQGWLGGLLLRLDQPAEAATAFRAVLAADATSAQAHHGLACAQRELGQTTEAIASCRAAIALEPAHAQAHMLLLQLLVQAGQSEAARQAASEALAANPHSEELQFARAAIVGEAVPSAPSAYVAAVFDHHAQHYDTVLVEQLQARSHLHLLEAVRSLAPDRPLDILDLGCGTGLCGPLFRPLAHSLDGIDLSRAMLLQARERHVYDRLGTADLVAFLQQAPPASYDLILAADVFVYVGDLAPTFALAAPVLRPGGLLAFTVEAHDGTGFTLRPTMRFAHSLPYLQALAARHALHPRYAQERPLRTDHGVPVIGWVVVLERPA